MKVVMAHSLEPLHMPILHKESGIFHGSFPRNGGCSPPPFNSLNVSFGVGDMPQNVTENRQLIQNYFGITTLISARQVHGAQVAVITEPQGSCEIDGFDAIICSVPDIGIMIQQADCQAILLYDPKHRVVAGIHSGWQSSVANIIQTTIRTMTLTFGTRPINLLAGISPSLGPCCAEFVNFKTEFPEEMQQFQTSRNHFDFWKMSTQQLITAGVQKNNISVNGTCSKCSKNFFSYRRTKQTGRFCSIIGLRHE